MLVIHNGEEKQFSKKLIDLEVEHKKYGKGYIKDINENTGVFLVYFHNEDHNDIIESDIQEIKGKEFMIYTCIDYNWFNNLTVKKEKNDNVQKPIMHKISNREECFKYLKERGVEKLVHFTPKKNIESIKKRGILSTYNLKKRNIPFIPTDIKRIDDNLDYISCSITAPNYSYLNKIKYSMKILEIDLEIIKDKECLFYYTNAANRTTFDGVGFVYLSNISSLKKCFSDSITYKISTGEERTFERINLDSNRTTDEQAEIMIKNNIPVKYILNINEV